MTTKESNKIIRKAIFTTIIFVFSTTVILFTYHKILTNSKITFDYYYLLLFLWAMVTLTSIFFTVWNFSYHYKVSDCDVHEAIEHVRVQYKIILTIFTLAALIFSFFAITTIDNVKKKTLEVIEKNAKPVLNTNVTPVLEKRVREKDFTEDAVAALISNKDYLLLAATLAIQDKDYQKQYNNTVKQSVSKLVEQELEKPIRQEFISSISDQVIKLLKEEDGFNMDELENFRKELTEVLDKYYELQRAITEIKQYRKQDELPNSFIKSFLNQIRKDEDFRNLLFPNVSMDQLTELYVQK